MLTSIRCWIAKLLDSTPRSFPYRYEQTINGCEVYVLGRTKRRYCTVLDIIVDDRGFERYGSITIFEEGWTDIRLDRLPVTS